jgi:hypothetical protein
MKTWHPLLLSLCISFLLVNTASAGLEEIIGTWRRADGSMVEFRPDGTIFTHDAQVGTWQKLRDSRQYTVRMNGAIGYHFQTSLGGYQRTLTLRHSGNGHSSTVDRIDDGPVKNPDVPDAHEALELEFTDLEKNIQSGSARAAQLFAEAAEARRKHEIARLMGKISAWIPVAQKKEAEAKAVQAGVDSAKRRLAEVEKKLGKTSRVLQSASVVQPVGPNPGVFTTGATSFRPGMVRPGYPPVTFPPEFVPDAGPPGFARPTTRR